MQTSRPVSETRQKMNRILQAKPLLESTRNLDEVYVLLNQLSSDVLDLYPHIACRSQCNTCCKGNSVPTVTPAEWAMVHDYLWRFYTPAQRQALIARTAEMYNPRKDLFWTVHDTIQQPADMDKLKSLAGTLSQLMETQCPMLVDEKCSIYTSRPAKCRAHGGFLYRFGEHVQLHTCESEVEKMELRMLETGTRHALMPLWNDFEDKISRAHNAPNATSTMLTIWLLSHIESGELIEDVNLDPDFEAFRLKDIGIS
ncbi:MAG: hypothetical protein CVV27_02460 [Candidatus Melainabacteria bacterium HGW-Melainabacteria-1]|nr:MAG: hypothetical protein CVV27_02460 [Candidatus Melainabacteria bacterium HGW-Melainabacteria-1]